MTVLRTTLLFSLWLLSSLSYAAPVLAVDGALRIARGFVREHVVDFADAEITSAHLRRDATGQHGDFWRIRWELQGSRRAKGAWIDVDVHMDGRAAVIYGK